MKSKLAITVVLLTIISFSAAAQESSKTRGVSCYKLGVRYAKCALTVASGLAPRCPSEFDFAKPSRCAQDSDFDRGLREGTEEFIKVMRKYKGAR